jgi:hypothetical protein
VQFEPTRYVLLLFATTFAACTTQTAQTEPRTVFDACNPPHVVADSGATTDQAAGIAAAIASWQAHGAPALGNASDAVVPVRFQPAAPFFHGLYDDAAGVIYINDDLTAVDTLTIVIAHELGHAFGLVHVSPDVRPSVMNPGNVLTPPNDDDAKALAVLWGACATGS